MFGSLATRAGTAFGASDAAAAPSGQPLELRHADSYRRLAEIFHEVLSEQDRDSLLERIAATLADLVPYDALVIYGADEARRELAPVFARSDDYLEEIFRSRPLFGQGITGWAVEHRLPVLANRAHLDPRVEILPGTPPDPEALIAVPLVTRGSVLGCLNIYRLGEHGHFADDEFELAKRFADAAGLALDNAQTRARLEHEAQTDSLTGLYNHRYFHERLRSELIRASRTGDTVAVLMLDLDDFKRVNDVHGHGCGDQLLIGVAEMTKDAVRGSDVVCRLGGEEFGVIMTSCGAGDAVGLAGRLKERLAGTEFEAVGRITVSIGIALGREHAMNPRELVACADEAMLTAKARGKNKVVLYDERLTTESPGRAAGRRDVRSIAHLRMLQSLSIKLNRLNDVHEIGMAIANELRVLVDYHNCRVYLREGEDLVPIAFRGCGCSDCEKGLGALECKVGQGVTGRAAETGASILVRNGLECDFALRVPDTAEIEESLLAVPLLSGTRTTGVLVMAQLGSGSFDVDDVQLLEVLAGHASVALEKARQFQQTRREADEAKDLLCFSDALLGLGEVEEIARESVRAFSRLLDASEVSLYLRSRGKARCVARYGELRLHKAEELVAPLVEVNGYVSLRPGGPGDHFDAKRLKLLDELVGRSSVALARASR